jgi:hypothetical protein
LNVQTTRNGPAGVLDLKYVILPLEKNKIFIRVENLNDNFDGITEALPFDIEDLAKKHWDNFNPNVPLASVNTTEMSITGNMAKSTMEARRLIWKTIENPTGEYSKKDVDGVLPMQIKVFLVEYNPS